MICFKAASLFQALIARMSFPEDERRTERQAMVTLVGKQLEELSASCGQNCLRSEVLAAMLQVPRHLFVPADQQSNAYKNRPLAIGYGQTISQPFIVALMSSLLDLKPGDRVLEAGTGSGYQAAVLSLLASDVYSIEVVAPLGERAARVLSELGVANVHCRIGDGYAGWPEEAPFDAIIVTAAPEEVPPALIAQLKPGGRLVIPVGITEQDLMVIEKQPDGTTVSRTIVPVRFVPLVKP